MSALTAVLDERLAAWRRGTPGCQGRVHLNNAGASVSPHDYNTREEVDTLVDAIEALIQEERR